MQKNSHNLRKHMNFSFLLKSQFVMEKSSRTHLLSPIIMLQTGGQGYVCGTEVHQHTQYSHSSFFWYTYEHIKQK